MIFAECIGKIRFRASGSTATIGLSDTRLETLGAVRAANDLSFIPPCDGYPPNSIVPTIYVWTVGDDYPVAYHLEIEIEVRYTGRDGFSNTTVYLSSTLGYGRADSVRRSVETWIAEEIQNFAGTYLRAVPQRFR